MITLPTGAEPHVTRYLSFISSRPKRANPCKKESGYNRHHIIPVALGGKKGYTEEENLIKLTPREHYIAHLILWKAYGKAMARAFWLLSNKSKRMTGRMYEKLNLESTPTQHSDETRQKMRLSHLGKTLPKEQREKISLALKGRPSFKRGRPQKLETIRKRAISNTGGKRSEETKQKMRLAKLGKKASEETKQKQRDARNRYLSSLEKATND